MDVDKVMIIVFLIILGIFINSILMLIFAPNFYSDIGLSQEAGDLICQKLTNSTNAFAIDWNLRQGGLEDSLICDNGNNVIEGGLVSIRK